MIRECLHGYAACISDSINKVFEADECMHASYVTRMLGEHLGCGLAGFHRSGGNWW